MTTGISELTKRSLGNVQATLQRAQQGATFHRLPLDAIVVVSNIRTKKAPIDETAPVFIEFSENIKQYGVQEPILVRPAKKGEGKYELIAGERRWRGARRAGLADIPAMVKHVADDEVFMLQVIENIHRENLTQLQEADALKEAMSRFKSLDAVAKKWNRSKGWVSERLQLLDLAPAAQALITDGITADVAVINSVNRAARVDDEAGEALAKQVRVADKKRDVARRGLVAVKEKAGKSKPSKAAVPADWGREGARLAGALASAMKPTAEKAERMRQVRATVGSTDQRATAALQEALKAAHAAGIKLAKGWQSGLGGSLSLLAAQLDAQAAGSMAGRALVLKAFALGAMKQPYKFETIVVS